MQVLFNKRDHITSLAAAKALIDPALGVHVERGRLFLVEWAQAEVITTGMTQLHVLAYHVNDVRLDAYFIDDMWRDAHG